MRISSSDFEARREVAGGAGPVVEAPSVFVFEFVVVEFWVVGLEFALEAAFESAGFEVALPNRELAGAVAVVEDGVDDVVAAGFEPNRLGVVVGVDEAGAAVEGVELG